MEVASAVMSGSNGELAAIETIRRGLPEPPEGEIWIGDDAAVVACPAGKSLLLAADAVVEGVHFDLDLVDAADVGWKALVVNVSDIAAMGGRPLHALVTVVGATAVMIEGLVRGLAEAAAAYDCAVVGGDLSSGPRLVITVAITGTTGDREAVLRSNARPGDLLFVTGALGRSAAGLRALRAGKGGDATLLAGPAGTSRGAGAPKASLDLAAAYRRPVARVPEGLAASAGGATAMIDVSDGLGIDLDRLATASGVGVVLDAVPTAEGSTREEALGGGEDYELVFAARDPGAIERAFEAAGLRAPIRIGACVADPRLRLIGTEPLGASGWEHRLS
ncbi:MAG: thiamine-phosphate kinase [Acidimicrobiales bacterium]